MHGCLGSTRRLATGAVVLLGAATLGCASTQVGESYTWKKPCGTHEQRDADRDACAMEAAGLADPSGQGREYTPDLFRQCMESRGWQRVPSSTVLACE